VSEYQETIKTIAKTCANEYAADILAFLQNENGSSAESLFDSASLDDKLERLMIQYWTSLTDSSNDYWRMDQVTAEDKMIVFRKLKKDVEPYLGTHLMNVLREEALAMQAECEQGYKHYLQMCKRSGMSHTSLLSHLLELQQELQKLMKKASDSQKLRMFLAGKGVWLDDQFQLEEEEMNGDKTRTGEEETGEKLHKFERKLRGGIVTSVHPQGTFVPESEIRRQGIEHGDLLRVKKSYRYDGQIRYQFELAEKRCEPLPERIQLDRCLVKVEASMYYADSYMENGEEQLIRIGGAPHRILIKEDDVQMFKLEPGDQVDIAYWANHPIGAKVIWKHMDSSKDQTDPAERKDPKGENAHIA
jgi:hypothetical protein